MRINLRANRSNAGCVLSAATGRSLCFAAGGGPVTFTQFLNQWWNLPYLVMLGLVAVFFALQAVGMIAHAVDADAGADVPAGNGHATLDGDGAADHDLASDTHVGGDNGAYGDHGADGDHGGEGDHGADGDHDSEAGYLHGVGAFLGVGRVPFMVIWLTLFIFAGFGGLFVNRVLQVRAAGYRPWFFPLSLAAALGAGVLSVRFASRAVGKLVDLGGRGASRRRELAGSVGVVASPVLDDRFGEVRVRDGLGNELIVHGHLSGTGAERALKQGEKVVLVELESESGLFHVAALKE